MVGSRAIPGSTGSFSVTGLPWQPVAVVFFNQFEHLGDLSLTLGCATADDEQWSVWTGASTQISGYLGRKHEGRTDACAFHRNPLTDATHWSVSFVSLTSDGFTLSLDVRNSVSGGEGGNLYYMALGGDHIQEAHAGTFAAGQSTGNVAVTAPGFQPTGLIFAHVTDSVFDGGISGSTMLGTGVTDGNAQFASFVRSNQSTAIDVRWFQRTDSVACYWDGTYDFRMAFSSFDANGFTVNVTDSLGVALDIMHAYLAVNADGAVAGNDIQPDSSGTQSYATPGLNPGGVFFCWPGVDSSSTSTDSTAPLRPGVGAGTATQNRMSSAISRVSAPFGVYTPDGYQVATDCLGFYGTGIATDADANNAQAIASISSMQDDSFVLDWSTVVSPTPDRRFGWLALPGELTFLPQIYRIIRVPETNP